MNDVIESPCLSICQLGGGDVNDPERYCFGCFRTIDEIVRWGSMSADERKLVMADLASRKDRLETESDVEK